MEDGQYHCRFGLFWYEGRIMMGPQRKTAILATCHMPPACISLHEADTQCSETLKLVETICYYELCLRRLFLE